MTPEVTLADHGARITNVEKRQDNQEKKLDWIFRTVLLSALGIAGELLFHIITKK